MSVAIFEEVLEKVKLLSIDEQLKLREVIEQNEREEKRRKHVELVRSLCGKYRDQLSSVDEFLARKQEEIDLEDKGWRPKE